MRENRERWLSLVRAKEGGWSDLPADRGGPTNMGITLPTLSDWLGRPATVEELSALTWDTAAAIYSQRYWNRILGDEWPSGLDVALGDAVVTSRMTTQVKLMQGILGVKQDGYVGPVTIAAARKADTARTIIEFTNARLAYLKTLPDWQHFGRGWENRCNAVEAECLALVQPNVVEAKVPTAFVEGGLYGLLVLIVASLPDLWPQLGPNVTGAQRAAADRDWAAFSGYVFAALALIAPAVVRSFVRWRAYREVAR